jgi:hypothetical protein
VDELLGWLGNVMLRNLAVLLDCKVFATGRDTTDIDIPAGYIDKPSESASQSQRLLQALRQMIDAGATRSIPPFA